MAVDLSYVKAVVAFQAHVRGYFTRKKLLQVRKEFEEVLKDLERDAKVVQWKKNCIGLPLVTSKTRFSNPENETTSLSIPGDGEDEKTQKKDLEADEVFSDGKHFSRNIAEHGFTNPENEGQPIENENVKFSRMHREQDDEEINVDKDCPLPATTLNFERCHVQDSHRNQLDFPQITIDYQREREPEDPVIPSKERNPENNRSLSKVMHLDKSGGKQFQTFPEFPSPDFPLSGTPRHTSSDEQKIKENSGYDITSETDTPVTRNVPHLQTQAILSESWMTDKSFEPVVSEDSTTPNLDLPDDPDKLHELRDNLAMELLWTQQAIESRKKVSRSTIILFQTVMTLRRVFFFKQDTQ
ncbi:IQ domain-containing protein C-like isoform X3 [Montipora capricornis]|uniref:IQ domain-containing protein C-like isoform X3 n=1 Tax=Montipora capricornis TaxID=246305 RepID=UPI0035F10E15